MTPSRVGWLSDEIQRNKRRMQNLVLSERERTKCAELLCELWEELHETQTALHKTYHELEAMDPSNVEMTNAA